MSDVEPVACVGVDDESRDSFLKRKLFISAFYTFKVGFARQAEQLLLHFRMQVNLKLHLQTPDLFCVTFDLSYQIQYVLI